MPGLTSLHHGHLPLWHNRSASAKLETTRVEIVRCALRSDVTCSRKANEDAVVFYLRVFHGTTSHDVEKSFRAFMQLKDDLLTALEPGHMCPALCPWLWEDLRNNFDRPKKHGNIRAWLQIRLHRHTAATNQIFLEHFQELLDSLLHLLRKERTKCDKFSALCVVLARFLHLVDPNAVGEARPASLSRRHERDLVTRASI